VNVMEAMFFTVVHMTFTASLVIIAVLLARLALRKAPKVYSYALWGVALFRLLCPFTIGSRFGLMPNYAVLQPVPLSEVQRWTRIETDIVFAPQGSSAGSEPFSPSVPAQMWTSRPVFAPQSKLQIASWVWLAGVVILLGYGVWSLARLRRKLACSVPLEGENGVRLADHIPSPFVFGLLSPTIYLPSGLPEGERDYILLHERTHIRRLDHITRALGWLAVAVHWFNPLVWLAFHLSRKDMEMSCDETVLRRIGRDVRTDYSTSLLRISTGGKLPAGPLAFGCGNLETRIENVLSYHKPARWVPVLALILVLTVGTALATSTGGFINPNSVTSVTNIPAPAGSPGYKIYTSVDGRESLFYPSKSHAVDKEYGDELIWLVNSYRKSVYGHGELDLDGSEHHFFRLTCSDGSYYLIDYWYWNGFSWNPLHFGEDPYTTLVTRYDSQGNAGTTWQMEYIFDWAFQDWWYEWRDSIADV